MPEIRITREAFEIIVKSGGFWQLVGVTVLRLLLKMLGSTKIFQPDGSVCFSVTPENLRALYSVKRPGESLSDAIVRHHREKEASKEKA